MVASKSFDLYLKKNIFTIYLAFLSIIFIYYLYIQTEEHSLYKIDKYLQNYEKKIDNIKKYVNTTKKLFGELKLKIDVVSKFENYSHCDIDIQAKQLNFLHLDIPERNFDFSRNLNVIYDPIVEISKTNFFSFDHNFEYNNDSITINFMKDNYNAKNRFKIPKVCYFIIGFKK